MSFAVEAVGPLQRPASPLLCLAGHKSLALRILRIATEVGRSTKRHGRFGFEFCEAAYRACNIASEVFATFPNLFKFVPVIRHAGSNTHSCGPITLRLPVKRPQPAVRAIRPARSQSQRRAGAGGGPERIYSPPPWPHPTTQEEQRDEEVAGIP